MSQARVRMTMEKKARPGQAFARALWAVAVLCLFAGVITTGWTAYELREISNRLSKNFEHLEKLRSMEREMNAYTAARTALEDVPGPEQTDIEPLILQVLSAYSPQVRKREQRDIAPGWSIAQREVSVAQAPLREIALCIEAVEREHPPWRLQKLTAHASPQSPGSARVVLLFSAITRNR